MNSSLSFDTIQSTVIKTLHFLDLVFKTKMVTITEKTEIKCYIIKTQKATYTVQIRLCIIAVNTTDIILFVYTILHLELCVIYTEKNKSKHQ